MSKKRKAKRAVKANQSLEVKQALKIKQTLEEIEDEKKVAGLLEHMKEIGLSEEDCELVKSAVEAIKKMKKELLSNSEDMQR